MQKTVQNESVSPLANPVATPTAIDEVKTAGKALDKPEPLVAGAPEVHHRLVPRAFKNDLTPERKEELVKQFSDSMRAELGSDTLSVNFVARLVNRQHRQVGAILVSTDSATEAVDQLLDKTGKYVDRLIAKLTPEQREEVLKKLQNG